MAHTQQLIEAALDAAAPQTALRCHMTRDGDWLRVGARKYHLPDFSRVLLLGFGKAAAAINAVGALEYTGTLADLGRLRKGVLTEAATGAN